MIDKDVLNAAGIDYSEGLERFSGDAEFYEMVLRAFVRADIAERSRAAFDADDREALLSAAHEAKGSGGNAGLKRIYAQASALVKLLRSGDYTEEELTESFLQFEKAYLSTQTAIKASLK